jgi:hypothetical protein
MDRIDRLVKKHNLGDIICDEDGLKSYLKNQKKVKKEKEMERWKQKRFTQVQVN